MGAQTKDVRLSVTLDDGENLLLPGEAVTLDADKADALIRMGYATPLYAGIPADAAASASGKGKRKGTASPENVEGSVSGAEGGTPDATEGGEA